MSEQSIEIVEYNPNWTSMFESEKEFLTPLIEQWVFGTIEHVGSTSVHRLAAKPVIDIMIGVKSLDSSRKAIEVLSNSGYYHYPCKAEVMHWF
jgi:GrpB-like predicted nucleotidyltransferase (UPF0157 family)